MTGEDLVVGSGPAGVSAAYALLAQGRRVRMIDVGITLEADHELRRARMAAVDPDLWSQTDRIASMRARREARTDGMRPFGSDFPVRDAVGFFGAEGPPEMLAFRPSFAMGGLSNGWGAAVLPYRDADLAAWPAAARDLAPHYQAVSAFMPIAAARDDLADKFPMWRPQGEDLPEPGPQVAQLLNRLSRRQGALARRGISAGRARIAYAASKCRACGMCLFGCPYGVIFNAAHAVKKLIGNSRFSYEPGLRVVRFAEEESGVTLFTVDANGLSPRRIAGDRLFIAAGALPTTRIMLNSVPQHLTTLSLRDSQHALMPMLHAWAPPADIETAPRTAFAQAFLEIEYQSLSATTVHAQVYAYNDLYRSDLALRFGHLSTAFGPLIGALSRRLLVAQIFVHSDHGGAIGVSLDGDPGDARLSYKVSTNRDAERVLRRSADAISSTLFPSGVIALKSQLRLGALGSSFHVGASLPMKDRPKGNESDIFGRVAGLRRVHVIDASVFSSVPATTITFTVMANAHRIAADAPL